MQQPVKRRGRKQFHFAFAFPFGAHAVHNVIAFPPFCHELFDNLGRVLQVRVDYHHRIALCQIDTGSNGDLMSEIARKLDDLRIGFCIREGY